METQSHLQRHSLGSSEGLTARVQPRPFSDPQCDQAQPVSHDFSGVDLFTHDPGSRSTPNPIQTKLTVGAPNSKYEQEADRVAEQVLSMPDSATQQPIQRADMAEEEELQAKSLGDSAIQREAAPEEEVQMQPLAASITPVVQRDSLPEEEEVQAKPLNNSIQREALPEEEEPVQMKALTAETLQRDSLPEEEEVQTKPSGNSTIQREAAPEEEEVQTKPSLQRAGSDEFQATDNIESQISSSKGSGNPLPDDVRSFMEPRFGADFSQVRVHTGGEAIQMSQNLSAQAFTHGSDIYYGSGKAPANDALTAHELTHVVQQNGNQVQRQTQTVEPTVVSGTLQTQMIQRNGDHATQLAKLYDPQGAAKKAYESWDTLELFQENFTAKQWKKIEAAYELDKNGMPILRDRSGKSVSRELLNKDEQAKLDDKKEKLDATGTHMQILTYLEGEVSKRLGPTGVAQFYRGAHIVLKDDGQIYEAVKGLGAPIAAKNKDGSTKSKTEFVGKSGANFGGLVGNAEEQRAGKMFTRSPQNSETSHYQPSKSWLGSFQQGKDNTGYDSYKAPPQLGIDLPEPVKGHILVGIVPENKGDSEDDSTGHTFIQTEGAGFQNFHEASLAHGQGYLDNSGWTDEKGTQTGLVGKTMHSEKTKTEIREHENANMLTWDQLLAEAKQDLQQNNQNDLDGLELD